FFFFSSRRRHTRFSRDWSSDVCSSDLDTLVANTLASVVLINDGKGQFTIRELPIQAQFSPIHALLVKDINGDGNPDILTGGNSEVARVSTGPSTANYGMVFLGDGHGDFTLSDPVRSAITLRGYIRCINELQTHAGRLLVYGLNSDRLKVFKGY